MINNEKDYLSAIKQIKKASEAYYNTGSPIMTDREFDTLCEEIEKYRKDTLDFVGAPILNGLDKLSISYQPMLSLAKVHSQPEIEAFAKDYEIFGSIKCDGLSVRLIYNNGELVSANTRGDGYVGGNITEHIKYFLNVPSSIQKQEEYIIDGECIIFQSDFNIINKDNKFANPRNTASGALALLDMKEVANRRLSFLAWDVIKGGNYDSYIKNLQEADYLGFSTVPTFDSTYTNEEIIEYAKKEGIPCDGVVWRIDNNNIGKSLPSTAHHPGYAIAWKPKNEEYETTLRDIEWSMGRTGILTPVAVYEDVETDDSIINRASLHNISVLKEVLHGTGYWAQKIKVFKANMIIPQVCWAEEEPEWGDVRPATFEIPTTCPICNGNTIIKSNNGVETLWCENPNCDGKIINKLEHCYGKKGLDIKGISKATIGKFLDWGYIERPCDLFKMSEGSWKDLSNKAGFGKLSVKKLQDNISAAKRTELWRIIAAAGIPLIGTRASKDLAKYFKTWEAFREAVDGRFDFTQLPDIGETTAESIINFNYSEMDEMVENYLSYETDTSDEEVKSLNGMVFCITGRVHVWKNRAEIKDKIESLGGKVTDSVTNKTNYLINNDIDSTSSKNNKAKSLNIPIISEEELLTLIEGK